MSGFAITAYGDCALNVEFSQTINSDTSLKVRLAAQRLKDDPIKGITEIIPTFCTLTICYNPLSISYDELSNRVQAKLRDVGRINLTLRRIISIPVCYEQPYAPDLQTVANYAGLSCEQVVELHSNCDYYIDMLGFLPGFAYLGGLNPRIHIPRLDTPRINIEPGSVAIGGSQTGVYPLASPGGWHIIGRTPVKLYDPTRAKPVPYSAGEYIRFVPITPEEYTAIEAQVAAGTYQFCVTVEGD